MLLLKYFRIFVFLVRRCCENMLFFIRVDINKNNKYCELEGFGSSGDRFGGNFGIVSYSYIILFLGFRCFILKWFIYFLGIYGSLLCVMYGFRFWSSNSE